MPVDILFFISSVSKMLIIVKTKNVLCFYRYLLFHSNFNKFYFRVFRFKFMKSKYFLFEKETQFRNDFALNAFIYFWIRIFCNCLAISVAIFLIWTKVSISHFVSFCLTERIQEVLWFSTRYERQNFTSSPKAKRILKSWTIL